LKSEQLWGKEFFSIVAFLSETKRNKVKEIFKRDQDVVRKNLSDDPPHNLEAMKAMVKNAVRV
jgi:hypothetical protein